MIVGFARIAPAIISRPDWAVVSAGVAVVALLVSLWQANQAAEDRRNREAVVVATIDELIRESLSITDPRPPVTCGGRPLGEGYQPRAALLLKLEEVKQLGAALQSIPISPLPRSDAALAVVHARLGLVYLQAAIEQPSSVPGCTTTNAAGYELARAWELLGKVRQEHFPTLRIGRYGYGWGSLER